MVDHITKAKREAAKKGKYPYPSPYGSHTSMIDKEETDKLSDPSLVVLKDDHGLYTTKRNRLDSGMADPNRNAQGRLEYLCPKTEHI